MTPFASFRHLRVTSSSKNPCEQVQKRAVPAFYEPGDTNRISPWIGFIGFVFACIGIVSAGWLANWAIEFLRGVFNG